MENKKEVGEGWFIGFVVMSSLDDFSTHEIVFNTFLNYFWDNREWIVNKMSENNFKKYKIIFGL